MTNPYLRDFHTDLQDRFAEDSVNMSMSTWLTKNTTLLKKPFSFKGYEFQRQIADDMSPDLSVIKPSQVGLSEIQIRKAAAFAMRNQGTGTIFTLPDEAMFKRMSNTRFAPMIEKDRVFNPPASSRPIRRTDLYQLGMSYVYFVGGVEGAATSINADYLAHDEIDLSDQELIALFQSRLQGSDHRITHKFSTPTFTGFGIDAHFRVSNQFEYFVKCESCNHHNLPEWNPNHVHIEGLSSDINDFLEIAEEMLPSLDLSPDKSYVFCSNCGNRLNLHDPSLREWVPRHPSRRARGYAVTPFSTHKLGPDYILGQQLNYQRANAIRRFHNVVLGHAYDDASARLSELEIRAIMDGPGEPEIGRETPVVIGIDVGQTCTVSLIALTEPQLVFRFAYVPIRDLKQYVSEVLEQYRVLGGLIDRYPETTLSNDIRDLSNGIILPCEYSTTGSASMTLVTDELGALSHVRGNRTEMLDDVANDIRKKKLRFAGYGHNDALIVQQLRSQVRIEKAEATAQWSKTDGNDHMHHSLAYAKFAIRAHNLVLYKSNDDPRSFFGVSSVLTNKQFDDRFGFRKTYLSP